MKKGGFSARGLLCLSLLLSACAAPNSASTPTAAASEAAIGESTTEPTQESGALTLNIWLPPQFDPAGGSLAASMLQSRLDEFRQQHPQARINARVKAETGAGGLLDSLLSAQQAAPLALPDLALLPGSLLLLAAEANLLRPIGSISAALNSDDWYPFAKQMVAWQGEEYGLPFAGDALVLAYRSTAVHAAPASWQDLLAAGNSLGFAAADPQALFALMQLLSLQSDQEPAADFAIPTEDLTAVFEFLTDGQTQEVFPFWMSQYQNSDQTWQAFTEGSLPMTAAWTSQIFANQQSEVVGAPLPTQDGQPFTLVRGWAWVITATDTQRAALAADLAEFLSSPEFLAQYTAAAGLLPPRPTSLAAWSPDDQQALASQIIFTAVALPDQSTLDTWGKALDPAVLAILKQEMTAAEAVESVRLALANSQ
jgi:ABC-type glycerol-3-phosphate transport system substrate-binding protein